MCASVVPLVIPIMVPLADGSLCGEVNPTRAGTKYTPLVSGTEAARASISPEERIILRPSLSHCTAEPVTETNPSTIYVKVSFSFHAIKLSTPPEAILQVLPIVISIKLPVPFVHFIVPASRQPCAKRADC